MTIDFAGAVVAECGGDRLVVRGRGESIEMNLDVPRHRVPGGLRRLRRLARRWGTPRRWHGPDVQLLVRGRPVARLGPAGVRTQWTGVLAALLLPALEPSATYDDERDSAPPTNGGVE